jgi:hypothetical protein
METLILTNTLRTMGDLRFSNDFTEAKIDVGNSLFITIKNGSQTSAAITNVMKVSNYHYEIATAAGTYIIKPAPSYTSDYGGYFSWMEQIMNTFRPRQPRVVQNPEEDMLRF